MEQLVRRSMCIHAMDLERRSWRSREVDAPRGTVAGERIWNGNSIVIASDCFEILGSDYSRAGITGCCPF